MLVDLWPSISVNYTSSISQNILHTVIILMYIFYYFIVYLLRSKKRTRTNLDIWTHWYLLPNSPFSIQSLKLCQPLLIMRIVKQSSLTEIQMKTSNPQSLLCSPESLQISSSKSVPLPYLQFLMRYFASFLYFSQEFHKKRFDISSS